jgi:hypothetical protein
MWPVWACNNISLEVFSGEILGLWENPIRKIHFDEKPLF